VGEKVYIFPFVPFAISQMQSPTLSEHLEPTIFTSVLQNSIDNKLPIRIASGYMNFTRDIVDTLATSQIPTEVLCSAPESNSFYRGGTLRKYIPYLYRNFEGMILSRHPGKFRFKEYLDGMLLRLSRPMEFPCQGTLG
jgi:hypothetical protein